jgi:hypothetical protein
MAQMSFQVTSDKVRMMFTGNTRGARTFGGRGVTPSGQSYRGGDNAFDKYIDADPRDVEWLLNTGTWAVVQTIGQLNLPAVSEVLKQASLFDVPVTETAIPEVVRPMIEDLPAPELTAEEKALLEPKPVAAPTPTKKAKR